MFQKEPGTAFDSTAGSVAVDADLTEWRRRVTHTLSVVCTIAYLPVILLVLLTQHPPFAWPMLVWAAVTYLTLAAGIVISRVNHRIAVWIAISASYVFSLMGSLAHPRYPYFAIAPLCMAIVALALIGARAGRIAAVCGALITLSAPFLNAVFPGLAAAIAVGPVQAPLPFNARLTQSLGMTANLVWVMALLDRYHLFLLRALASRRETAARLEQEAADRTTAHQNLQREMEERRRLEREIARVSDEERRNLGQDVHDGVCQELTGALLRCQALKQRLERGQNLAAEDLGALSSLLEEAIDEAYAVAKGLWPLDPDEGALSPALRALAKRTQASTGVHCRFVASGDVTVPDPTTAQHLYRIAQEALSNASRHANARHILVELQRSNDELVLRVGDDGTGMPHEFPSEGMGLSTMAYRAQVMEGDLTVGPGPDGGTSVVCRVPRTGNGAYRTNDGSKET